MRFCTAAVFFASLSVLSAPLVWSQSSSSPIPEFEVATVKLVNPPMGPHAVALKVNHDRATLEGATLRQLIVQAYSVQRVLVQGGPSWYDAEQYDVLAKTESANAPSAEVRVMLQKLLEERFKLTVHREVKNLTMYALIVGKLGPKFAEAKPEEASGVQVSGSGQITVRKQSLATLVNTLANRMDLPVHDMTGLAGLYDYAFDWFPDPSGPSIFTAVQEQLGLRLESRKGSVEVLMVDHAERPSGN